MKKTPIFNIIFLFYISLGFAQHNTSVLDSLKIYLDLARDKQYAYDLKESIELSNKVITLAREIDNDRYQFYAYNLVGVSYEIVSDFENAEKNYLKALEKAERIANDTLIGWIYNNLGNVYSEGYKDINKGISYYNKSLEIAEKINDTAAIVAPTLNIGWSYIDEKEYEKALPYLLEVEAYGEKYDNEDLDLQVNYLCGKYHVYKKNYGEALKCFSVAADKGETLKMYDELSDVYLEQSRLFEILNDSEKAFSAYKKYSATKEKVLNEERVKQLEIAKASFDLNESLRDLEVAQEEKAIQISIAEKSRIITIISIITAFVLVLLLLFLYKNYTTKNKLSNALSLQNSNLEKSKQEAEKLSQLKSQFISTVSHELRTPLYGVVGITSLLMQENSLSKKEGQYLKSLKFSSDYLLNLINDVLQLSKIESNKVSLEKTDFNIRALLQNIADSFEYLLNHRENELFIDVEDDVPLILRSDTIRLQQILINLIGNATKFTSKGKIWLNVKLLEKKAGDLYKIGFEVKDNGIGIPKEKQEEIFDNFLQIERDDSGFQGTGLGLSIVKKLIKLFGGEIFLESEAGKGSRFYFDIDFKIGKDLDKTSIYNGLSNNIHIKNKILIVDDNKINQVVTENILKKEKFKTAVVDSGESAIKEVKKQHFDLILMDLNMPRMNGFEATAKIREFNKTIPIIALTAVTIDEIKDQILDSGFNDIINKPYDVHEFYQVILRNMIAEE